MSRVIIITGPTASGKSDMAIEVAKSLDGEIICADSMQIYGEIHIGTARLTQNEMRGIPHHLMGFLSPAGEYSVAGYKSDATKVIEDILSRKKTPIVCGGTGLYINSLTYELDFTAPKADVQLRDALETEYDVSRQLVYAKLRELNPDACDRVHVNDKRRVVRALEIAMSGNLNYDFKVPSREYDFALFAPDVPRDVLYERINQRVDVMMQMGLEDEVRALLENHGSDIMAFAAIGYKEFLPYLRGEYTLARAVELIKRNSRRYAKRQLTWFRREARMVYVTDANEILQRL